ncbi:hypothetical protein CCR75_007846 [Bremia lactucae]|uniref:Uncharacterized protein n=1 Tax=Bremia lactucae TaxID=4779 RepID=A0A976FIW7_BRELC|nr:hypothetical protein CCR75_007846 [Bremia lactucae]
MSFRREVVSLSQLLRRNNSSWACLDSNRASRQGIRCAPPLPLQTSRPKAEMTSSADSKVVTARQARSTSIAEILPNYSYEPVSFTHQMAESSHVFTRQAELGAASQASTDIPALSQEGNKFCSGLILTGWIVYEGESQQLSAITSMSQSSFSETPSQNLLAVSHDDQNHGHQQWQTEQTPSARISPSRCCDNENVQKIKLSITEALVEHSREHLHQQKELLTRFDSSINASVVGINARIEKSDALQEQQAVVLTELRRGLSDMAESVAELRKQVTDAITASEKARLTVETETAAVKAAITELQEKVKGVENSVMSCSSLVTTFFMAKPTKHDEVLSTQVASICDCSKRTIVTGDASVNGKVSKKRRRNSCKIVARCGTSSATDKVHAHESDLYDIGYILSDSTEEDKSDDRGLLLALRRIENLRAKRCRLQQV